MLTTETGTGTSAAGNIDGTGTGTSAAGSIDGAGTGTSAAGRIEYKTQTNLYTSGVVVDCYLLKKKTYELAFSGPSMH